MEGGEKGSRAAGLVVPLRLIEERRDAIVADLER